MTKLCGLYARVSTERQSEIKDGSLDTQISRLKSYIAFRNPPDTNAKQDEWKVIDVYREEGKSGKNTDRPELQRLLEDVKYGRINAVICTKLDRITRSLLDFYKLIDTFEKQHVEFISLEENFDTSTPMGKTMLKITLIFAELEREQTSKRTKDKMQWRAEQGFWNGGQILGYDLIDKKLVANPKEAKLVKLMFEKYLELGSVLQVVGWLNTHGYRTKEFVSHRKGIKRGGRRFFNTYILKKLTSKVYLGHIAHNKQVYPGQHEAIIDEKLWNEANRLIKLNAPKRINPKRQTTHVFILQGLVKCGGCGNYMTTKYSTGRNGLHAYYQCTKNAHGGKDACDMKYVPAAEFEKVILDKLKEMSKNKKFLQKIVKEANESTESTLISLKKDRKIQENKLKPIQDSINNVLDAICKGVKSEAVSNKLKELELQKQEIEKDIQNIDFEINQVRQQVLNATAMHESLTKFSQIYANAAPLELKELVPRFVEKITWKPTEIEIALFDHEEQKGQLPSSNPSSSGALEVINWLPNRGRLPNFSVELIAGLNNSRNGQRWLVVY